MIKSKFVLFIMCLLAGSIIYSCKKDDVVLRDPQNVFRPWNIAAPVFSLKLAAADLLENLGTTANIFVNPEDSVITLEIANNYDVPAGDIIDIISDINYNYQHDIALAKKAAPLPPLYDTIPVTFESTTTYDSIRISTASLSVSVGGMPNFTGTYSMVFPGVILQNGTVLEFTGDISIPTENSENLDLSMLKLIKNEAGKSCFLAITTLDVEMPVPPPTAVQLDLNVKMNDIIASKIWGYFGQFNILEIKEDMDFDFLEGLDFTELVQLKEIIMEFHVKNSYGIPFRITIDSMVFKNTINNEEVILELGGNDNLNIPAPLYTLPVKAAYDSLIINKDNSNLVDGVNIGPNQIHYEVSAEMNPEGETQKNFLLNNGADKLFIDTKLQVPFWFKTNKYTRTDTISFNISEIVEDSSNLDYLEFINLYFDFENGLPFSITTQAYLAKANGEVVDSVFLCTGPDAGKCDDSGRRIILKSGSAQNPETTRFDVSLTHDLVSTMHRETVTQIFLNTRVSTGPIDNPDFVKLRSDNYLNMRFAFEVKSSTIKLD